MSDEPTPPPEDEPTTEDKEPELYPFIDAAADGLTRVVIRAGLAEEESGEPVQLVVHYTGSAGSPAAMHAFETALEWYRDVMAALSREE